MDNKLRAVTKMEKKYVTCSLYKFVTLDNCEMLRQSILNEMKLNDLLGTILLAEEGINGTISGAGSAVDGFVEFLSVLIGSDDINTKRSTHDEVPFYRAKVKLKREIVSMGVEDIDPKKTTGIRVDPVHWNNLINDPEVLVIDTRNSYEVGIGTFKDAVNPNTKSFRDFPEWAQNNINPQKHSRVAMFCTGGIRCEKSTAYAKDIGVKEVYQLEGGILNYLRTVPEDESLWSGECFVFDNRVTVNHDLEKGSYDQCHACRMPITTADKMLSSYAKGQSCKHCFGTHNEQKQQRFSERQRQIMLSKSRGEDHIGAGAHEATERRRAEKKTRRGRI